MNKEIEIPEGYEARIEGNKIILERKESEDERIREWIIKEIKATHDYDSPTSRKSVDDAIAYLERQKEQKPASDNSEKPNNHAEWSEDTIRKAIEEVGLTQHQINWFKNNVFPPKQEWSEEDTFILEDAVTAVDLLGNDDEYSKTHPNLAKAFRVAKDFLKSLPERFNLQPKQEWSEEDVEKLAKIRASKSGVLTSEMTFYRQGVRDAFNYKGLRPSWKPSREQLLALKEQTSWLSKTNPLHSLYHQLCEL